MWAQGGGGESIAGCLRDSQALVGPGLGKVCGGMMVEVPRHPREKKRFLDRRSVFSREEAFSREKTHFLLIKRFFSRENASPLEKPLLLSALLGECVARDLDIGLLGLGHGLRPCMAYFVCSAGCRCTASCIAPIPINTHICQTGWIPGSFFRMFFIV